MEVSVAWALIAIVVFSLMTAVVVHYLHEREGEYETSDPYYPETYDPSGESALPQAIAEAQRTLDEGLNIHSEQTNKAIKMAQINGVIITALIAIISNFKFGYLMHLVFVLSGVCFTTSTILAVLGTRGQSMTIGIGRNEFDKIIEYDLSKKHYNLWMLNHAYREWVEEGQHKVGRKRAYVRFSIAMFLCGVVIVTIGFFITSIPFI